MRIAIAFAAATLIATPVAAQLPQQKQEPRSQPSASIPGQIPPELSDPALADKLGRMMQVLSKSFLDMPVGELEAAMEGRKPTVADRRRTVREDGRSKDPNFDRNFQRQMANAQPMMRDAMKALVGALPAMMQGMSSAAKELEKATANMPSPTYPKE